MFSFTRFCLRVLADLNEIIRRIERNVILTIAIYLNRMMVEFAGRKIPVFGELKGTEGDAGVGCRKRPATPQIR